MLWGAGYIYLERRALLEYELLKGNIECVAFCVRDKVAGQIEGVPVIDPEEIKEYEFDYILVFSDLYFEEIKREIVHELGYKENVVLSSKILLIYGFDFKRYIDVYRNPVTIVCKDCLAAVIYHNLHLPFSSPFSLTAMTDGEFFKLLSNFDHYFNSELFLVNDADINRGIYATAALGDIIDNVKIMMYHYRDFREAKEAWVRRKKRVNTNRFLFIASISNEIELGVFKSCKIPGRKLGFVTDPDFEDGEIFYYLPRYRYYAMNSADKYGQTLSNYLRNNDFLSHGVDVLKMLSGDPDFVREI